jgi:RNA polymerase sigma factor (sigma-70 family)
VSPEQADEGYEEEVTALYQQFWQKVEAFLRNMGCDSGLAEEITRDAFLTARRNWARVRRLEWPAGYVFKVARNERCKRQKAHDDRARDLHPQPQDLASDAGSDFAQEVVDRIVIHRALLQLPPTLREAVVLRHVADLSEAATAEIMGVKQGSVKRYAFEGRRRLHELLEEFQPEEGRRSG